MEEPVKARGERDADVEELRSEETDASARAGAGDNLPVDLADLDRVVGYVVRRAQVWLYQDARRALKAHEITPAQFTVMRIIGANPGLAQVRVAEALLIERARLVAMLDRLEERGLLTRTRSAADRRSYELRLTKAGAVLLARLTQLIDAHEDRVLARIGPRGKDQLLQVLAPFLE